MNLRIGIGTDVHRLGDGDRLMIGGVSIPSDLSAIGHSDADVLLHAATDAILGALAAGDIGVHFPNSDERWRDAESSQFLSHAARLASQRGYRILNIDSTVDLEKPKLRPYIELIRESLASLLAIPVDCVSVKAKTGEGVDAVGESRAIRAQVVVLLERQP